MEIKHINITITPDELEIIGFAVEEGIEKCAAGMSRETLVLLHEEEINLLRDLINAGYSIFLNAGGTLHDGRFCHDVNEFIDYLYREKDSVQA